MRPAARALALLALALLLLPAAAQASELAAKVAVRNGAPEVLAGGWTAEPSGRGALLWVEARDANGGLDVVVAVFVLEGPEDRRELPGTMTWHRGARAHFEALVEPGLGEAHRARVRLQDRAGAVVEQPLPRDDHLKLVDLMVQGPAPGPPPAPSAPDLPEAPAPPAPPEEPASPAASLPAPGPQGSSLRPLLPAPALSALAQHWAPAGGLAVGAGLMVALAGVLTLALAAGHRLK